MTHLFIVAHPDDEILGCCGTIMRLKAKGERVVVAVFSKRSATREKGLEVKLRDSHKELGVDSTYCFDYEMMKFDKYDRHEMTQCVESLIAKEIPDAIYTHDYNDLHNDHRVLSQIVMEASKLPLRRINRCSCVPAIYLIEIPSSTDWGLGFAPNSFVSIDESALYAKDRLLREYDNVLREIPHPRNLESFKALARYRGGQCGCKYAEAYRKVFEVSV